MPKGVERQALANSGTAQQQSGQLYGNSQSLYNSLAPQLINQSINPQGLSPTDQAAMKTSAMQTAGGSTAGAVGQGALLAARTRNAGTADAAIAKSADTAQQNLGQESLRVDAANASLKQQQKSQALSGLQGLNATELGGSQNALGLSNQSLGVADQAAANNPWLKLAQAGIGKL